MKLRQIPVVLIALAFAGIAVIYSAKLVTATEKKTDTPQTAKAEIGKISYPANAPQLASIKLATISEVSLPIADTMNGKLAYDENVTSRVSSPVAGRVIRSTVEIGDYVKRDTPLLILDSPDMATADADFAKAKADQQRKKLNLDRTQKLLEQEVIARKDVESAEADYLQAAAETKRAGLRMRNLNAQGSENGKFVLKAPISGLVTDKQINPGLEVRPDAAAPLLTITDLNRLWVLVDVPERYIGNIKNGQKIQLEFDAYPDQIFDALVDRVGLALDPTTRRIQIRGILNNKDGKLRPEMFARVSFLADSDKKAFRIPNAALIVEGLYNYVFLEKRPGEFQKQKINIVRKDRDVSYADVASNAALNNKQRVVEEGALLLNAEVASHAQ
ncbi:efflux RND transporter periplasmic adaptor subunit [Undibacterium sp. 14-3-2]|uniref:efflux RND transporter periplasmic adaptor subunit n=1 Tax=Undibacterium sp. 14-3-2 TaxID=2800129 RepID=UPI001908B829|nr:efflux RND transporter periplasmic adaptor subunit [Undibacterium sp. 14-3-2]MBK1890878.1 efflux RND transporter periplasmic adaptor subunit [Undibacterium sp. 14-3-2]